MNNAKALVTSKVFIIAVIQALVAAIVIFESAYPAAGFLVLAKSVLDIVLRVYTSQPIAGIISDRP